MASESFRRLPQHIQDLVTGGLDAEIQSGFERIKEAQSADDRSLIAFLEGDIIAASSLRLALSGEEAKL